MGDNPTACTECRHSRIDWKDVTRSMCARREAELQTCLFERSPVVAWNCGPSGQFFVASDARQE